MDDLLRTLIKIIYFTFVPTVIFVIINDDKIRISSYCLSPSCFNNDIVSTPQVCAKSDDPCYDVCSDNALKSILSGH